MKWNDTIKDELFTCGKVQRKIERMILDDLRYVESSYSEERCKNI